MSDTQANTIRDLLVAALSKYDSNIKLNPSSRAYTTIVQPIYDALTPDMFDTDLDEYLLAMLKEEYPSLELQDGDLIVDLLVKPLRILLEPLKTELNLLKKRQSVSFVDAMTLEDAEDLAANFFVTRRRGQRARGTVRVLLSSPTFLSISDQVRFSTADGLRFYPIRQQFINAETTALQQIGSLYYVDIGVIAEAEGDEYNIPANSITLVEGIPNYVSVTNTFIFEQGLVSESKQQLLARTEQSLTERSLTSRKGITARINDDFPLMKSVSVVGYGDPEMERDILTGTGDGFLVAAGMSFIVGRYMFMITGYEDSEGGNKLPAVGDKLKLNFWKFMYTNSSVEDNYVEDVIYSSYGDAPDMPTVHILLLKHDIQRQPITGGYLPGVYLGVFTSVFSDATITLSGLPDGIVNNENALPTRIKSGKVHIGGKYDVWVRPSATDTSASSISILKSPNIDEELTIFFDGKNVSDKLSGKYPLNRIGLDYYLETPTHSLYHREAIIGQTSSALGFIHRVDSGKMYITARVGSFQVNETITGLTSGNTTTIQRITYSTADPKLVGSVITTSSLQESYLIVDTYENYFITTKEIEEELTNVSAYVHSSTGVDNIFDPVFRVFPEKAEYSTSLQTFVGKSVVDILMNIDAEGISVGDVLQILSGEDEGRYEIEEIISVASTKSEVRLNSPMSRTNSSLRFNVIRESAPVDSPLLRILPDGLVQTGVTGQGHAIPYKHPVGAYALGAFSGSIAKYEGLNGFVLPNMSALFKGTGALVGDLALQADPTFMSGFSNADVDDCISEGCKSCDELSVTCTVTIDGDASTCSAVKFYMTGLISAQGTSYLTDFKDWIKSIIDAFFLGQNTQNTALHADLISFIDQFTPITLGEPPLTEHIIKQFELCVPLELFDSCNNSYLAIPEFIWDSEFASVSTFSEAINEFLSGRLRAKPTALKNAKPGDSLSITKGANLGEYVIDKVLNIPWYHGDTVATESTIDENGNASVTASIVSKKAYDFTIVIIRGAFPNEVLKGTSEYFRGSLPTVSSLLPTVPTNTLNAIHTVDIATGALKNPFDVIQEAYTVLFKTMYAQGFDLPDVFDLNPGPVLTKMFKSFFSTYVIGNRSPQQTTRMLFQDAIDVTVYAPKKCSEISWRKEVKRPGFILSNPIAIGGARLVGSTTVKVFVTLNPNQQGIEYSGVVSSDASTAADANAIVEYVQEALDPTNSILKVSQITSSLFNTTQYQIDLLQGGQGSFVKADTTTGLSNLGFIFVDERGVGEGTSTRSTDLTTVKTHSNNGTQFSITQRTVERRLVVDIQDNEDYFAAILPRRTTNLSLSDTDLPRDSVFSEHYTLAESCTLFFTEQSGESAIEAGVVPGDLLYVYEQVCTLDNTGVTTDPFSEKKDRLLHVRYNDKNKEISLLDTAGTFLTPESTNVAGESPEQDVVEVGDIVYFEDLGETARVTAVTETTLRLDTAVSAFAQQTVAKHGKDGTVTGTTFRSINYTFTPNDVGNYLVVYGSEHLEVDGTYTINSVAAGDATLSETFDNSESDLHWLIVKPTFDEIGSSSVGGYSETIGVTPIRIYRGNPKKFVVGEINHFLARNKSQIEVLYGDIDGGPRRGFRQPFKVVRSSEYRLDASQMQAQGKVAGLYYFDVPTTTLSPTFDLNIPENTQYTPIVNTLFSRGYYLQTKDRATVFSTREHCSLVIDSSYIPKTLSGSVANTQSAEAQTISVSYDASPEASVLQTFLDSDENRNLCADPLVKHFLPSYVLLEVLGGQVNEDAQEMVIDYINDLSPTDSIRLSTIEGVLHQADIDRYDHPIFIQCLTHDLSRNIILTRVNNYVDDSTILHDGTNRITYFIAASETIKVGEEIE